MRTQHRALIQSVSLIPTVLGSLICMETFMSGAPIGLQADTMPKEFSRPLQVPCQGRNASLAAAVGAPRWEEVDRRFALKSYPTSGTTALVSEW